MSSKCVWVGVVSTAVWCASANGQVGSVAGTNGAPFGSKHWWTVVADGPGSRLGSALAAVGDLDGDTLPELLVGEPRGGTDRSAVGAARVISGGVGTTLFAWSGAASFERFGEAVAAGDVDGDGRDDLIVGAPFGDEGLGRVEVRSGHDGELLQAWSGSQVGAEFGAAVAVVGDVDDDGLRDVAVGAPRFDGGATNGGRVEVRSGRNGAVLWAVEGGSFDQFGAALATADDIDDDSVPELAVGIPFADSEAFNGGAVRLLSGVDGEALWQVSGDDVGDQLGFSVAAVADCDGDGVADLVATLPSADDGGTDSGAAWVLSGLDGAQLLTIAGDGPAQYLAAAGGLGDVDGDGHGDLVVGIASAAGEAGMVRVHSGADGAALVTFVGPEPSGWFGAAVIGLGDVTGDGRPDLAVGAPGHDDDVEHLGRLSVLSPADLALSTDTHTLGVEGGGTQTLHFGGGSAEPGAVYIVLGSESFTTTGVLVDGVLIPVVGFGPYFALSVAGGTPIEGATGLLDGGGAASASISVPQRTDPALVGVELHHCFVVLGGLGQVVAASNSVPLTLVP